MPFFLLGRYSAVKVRKNLDGTRRSRVVQVFPSVASLERLVRTVMCDQDEAWSEARYFSERVMSELGEDAGQAGEREPPISEQLEGFRLVADGR